MLTDRPILRPTRRVPMSPARLRVLDTAAAAFAERGYGGTSVTQVATLLGASQGTVFYYYPSKIAVYLAVYERNLALLTDSVQDALDSTAGAPPATQLRALCIAYARHVLDHREYHAAHRDINDRRDHLALKPEDQDRLNQLDAQRIAIETTVCGLVAATSDTPRDQPIPPRLVTLTLLGALDSIATWHRPTSNEDDATRATIADQVVSLLPTGTTG